MKSRTSFFDTAVLKKNITRFAPVWVLYLVLLMMVMGLMAQDSGVWYASNMAESLLFMPALSFGYAAICAQLLFGDLFNSRMCNALHALPLRREGWFLTNVVTGLLFAIGPNTVMALLSTVLSGKLWLLPWAWLLCVTVQYLFFFGVAVLSAYLVGNRFAMGLVYLIINLFSLIAYWLVESLYVPNLFGIVLENQIFFTLSPLAEMTSGYEYLDVTILKTNGIPDGYWAFADGWGYIGICAAIGIGAMVLALALYRKRHLECAGDFIAVRGLGPVFLVLYTLCVGACCHGFFDLFLGEDSEIYLFIGLVVGFFTGLMLLERQVRVFRKKTFLAFAALALVFFGTIVGARADVLGIVRWVPKAEKIESVSINTGSSFYYTQSGLPMETPEDIENALFLHKAGLQNRDWNTNGKPDTRLELTYTMKNGLRHSREYAIDIDSEAGRLLNSYLSRPETVLQELHGFSAIDRAEFYDPGIEISDRAALAKLYAAIVADCEAGRMAQDWNFHRDGNSYYISLRYTDEDGIHYYREIMFWEDCQNIMAWVEEMGIEFEKYN